jgi:hypothetical protein
MSAIDLMGRASTGRSAIAGSPCAIDGPPATAQSRTSGFALAEYLVIPRALSTTILGGSSSWKGARAQWRFSSALQGPSSPMGNPARSGAGGSFLSETL